MDARTYRAIAFRGPCGFDLGNQETETRMTIMQVNLDDRVSRSILRFVDDIGQNATTWAVIAAVVVVVTTLLLTKKRK